MLRLPAYQEKRYSLSKIRYRPCNSSNPATCGSPTLCVGITYTAARGNGQAGHHDSQTFFNAQKSLKASLCTHPMAYIIKTDEVSFLYLYFPSRSILNVDEPATYTRIKDKWTAVLTVYADGRKSPIKIIVKSKRPKSLPRHLDAAKELGVFYKSQINSWVPASKHDICSATNRCYC